MLVFNHRHHILVLSPRNRTLPALLWTFHIRAISRQLSLKNFVDGVQANFLRLRPATKEVRLPCRRCKEGRTFKCILQSYLLRVPCIVAVAQASGISRAGIYVGGIVPILIDMIIACARIFRQTKPLPDNHQLCDKVINTHAKLAVTEVAERAAKGVWLVVVWIAKQPIIRQVVHDLNRTAQSSDFTTAVAVLTRRAI
eukprot:2022039-Rhodomonas_salina.3